MEKIDSNRMRSKNSPGFFKVKKGWENSHAELVTMIENVPMAILLVDKERVVRKANAAVARFAGTAIERMEGRRGGEALGCVNSSTDPRGCGFSPACDDCAVRHTISETFLKGKGFQEVEANVSIDHQGVVNEHVLRVHTSPVNIRGEQLSLVCIEDITERKRTEKELARLASFPRLNPNPIVEVDLSKEIVFFNEAAQEKIREIGEKHSVKDFLPKDVDVIFKRLKNSGNKHFRREVAIGKSVFEETIYMAPEFEAVRIYVTDVTKKKTIQKRIQYLGTHDKLTGLHNRNFFEKQLAKFSRRKFFKGAVVLIDINDLKKINDTFGHAAGDNEIKKTAKIINKGFRKSDTVARIGGDEFCVLFPNVERKEIEAAVKRLQGGVTGTQKNIGKGVRLGVAVGVAYAESGKDLSEALKVADARMYRNKSAMKKK